MHERFTPTLRIHVLWCVVTWALTVCSHNLPQLGGFAANLRLEIWIWSSLTWWCWKKLDCSKLLSCELLFLAGREYQRWLQQLVSPDRRSSMYLLPQTAQSQECPINTGRNSTTTQQRSKNLKLDENIMTEAYANNYKRRDIRFRRCAILPSLRTRTLPGTIAAQRCTVRL